VTSRAVAARELGRLTFDDALRFCGGQRRAGLDAVTGDDGARLWQAA
jgi:hypothetical protein